MKTNCLARKDEYKKLSIGLEAIVLIAATFVIFLISRMGIDGHHDGAVFNAANAITNGDILFKEVSTQYGALTVYIQAFFLKMFDNTILVMRISTVVFYCLSFLMFYIVFKRIIGWRLSLIGQIVWLFCAPFWVTTFHSWSSVYALFFLLSAMYFVEKYIDDGGKRWLFALGAASALAFWCRQPVGIVLLLSSILLILFCKALYEKEMRIGKAFILYFCGWILICIPFFICFSIQGSWIEWWQQSIGDAFSFVFFASPFWRKLQNLFGECCIAKMAKVATG